MGRGRGKGRRSSVVSSLDVRGNGVDDVLPTYKRRGRPQKPLMDDLDEEVAEKIELEEEDGIKVDKLEVKSPNLESAKKRKRNLLTKEKSESLLQENGEVEDSSRIIGSKQTGNRRKSTPRRAAGAGVKCMFD